MALSVDFAEYDQDNTLKSNLSEEAQLSLSLLNSNSRSGNSRLGPRHFSPRRYWKNLIVISLAFTFTFSAYSALANLQSSLNYSSALGVTSLVAIYVGVIISSFISPLVIWVLKIKWTLVVCLVFYAVYTASNIYPALFTLLPAALLLGLAASPVWTALATYITTSAIQLADVSDDVPETLINRFNGIFFCFFQSAQVWGNLISSLVLNNTSHSDPDITSCGRSSCGTGGPDFTNIMGPVETAADDVLVLLSIYIVLGLISPGIIMIFLDTLPKVIHRETDTWKAHLYEHLVSVFQIMKSPYLFLLIPLMIYNGAEQAYISADFTQAFVSCTQGAGMVGYVMIGFGVADAIASVIFGQLEKYSGRIVIFLLGGVVHMSLLIVCEVWKPDSSAMWQLVLMAVGWGVGDAVWQTQISSILGVLFPDAQEPAFANFRLWQAVGFAVTYALTIPTPICVYHKLYGLMGFLAFSLVSYLSVEYMVSREH